MMEVTSYPHCISLGVHDANLSYHWWLIYFLKFIINLNLGLIFSSFTQNSQTTPYLEAIVSFMHLRHHLYYIFSL